MNTNTYSEPALWRKTPLLRKQICIHPGVGAPTRQWPPAYFAALIDLLLGNFDVEIVLIGSADEAAVANEIIASVARPEAVSSLAGKVALGQLTELLVSTTLFIGNNSGPHHLAAALGVPTIGIHSGAVDAREWGPVGPNAVAVRRDMVCSPCYLADAAACPRGLACLIEVMPVEVYEICKHLLAIGGSLAATAG